MKNGVVTRDTMKMVRCNLHMLLTFGLKPRINNLTHQQKIVTPSQKKKKAFHLQVCHLKHKKRNSKTVATDPVRDARSVQKEIGKEFVVMMASGTVRASEAAAVTTKKVMQKFRHMNAAQS
nr:hypothetical protein [Tanacetum cinerariifolium]